MLTEQYLQRFGGIARLYGEDALPILHSAHFVVIGVGGVGSWTAEALARSGVGRITLIDLDDVCITNSNRQSHALTDTIGRIKVDVMAQRLRKINPEIKVHTEGEFIAADNFSELLDPYRRPIDVVIDAIDAARVKAALIAYCKARKLRLVTVGSAGGKRDPRLIDSADLGRTTNDPMLAKVRSHLYRFHNFQKSSKRQFGVDAIYSREPMVYPQPDGRVCQQKSVMQDGVKLDCSGGFGAATMVTGTFGFTAAARGIERLLQRARAAAAKEPLAATE
ncbi:tRNA cyclic N6-threonylcarbamoyladenosine(37) synthase TcdA [Microbulbifer thermotolerans]|uniref:tRNA cyclic N6-threonylcarbamoyladenosine(37) synthase TcdA n=1 Tax=Microbulbifer thermotolerans TaxID=252514 RepID=UPI00224A8D94|nr:tRNA cyclic N6-threonylcarbamoyladenosine(37) synthase TcdA [Microbulbifer thermotolerans]MCX2779611.1 tRNA cyclic N6-threonylcarbamoyladenosine(37) synthase TcdA [Microbulbifer thermotolerans]MCX2804958.1 tRNA cyclic N6-threonylcarbamoyladenosine(37) synthase TcdA [Microbulbifer thermotolerans]